MATNQGGIATQDVAASIDLGQRVYDVDGNKVGDVENYDTTSGWMLVEKGTFFPKDLYIPFSAVQSIDPREIYLSQPRSVLTREYTNPPPKAAWISDTVARGLDTLTTTVSTATPSGYGNSHVVVDSATDVESIKVLIADGMRLYDVNGYKVGTIDGYDAATGWMAVKKGHLFPTDLYIPITLVGGYDLDAGEVYLSVSKDDLQRGYVTAPPDVTFV